MRRSERDSSSDRFNRSSGSQRKSSVPKSRNPRGDDTYNQRGPLGKEVLDELTDTTIKLKQFVEEKIQENTELMDIFEHKEEKYKNHIEELEGEYTEGCSRIQKVSEKKEQLQKTVLSLLEDVNVKDEKLKDLEGNLAKTLINVERKLETNQELAQVQGENEQIGKKLTSLDHIIKEAKLKELNTRIVDCRAKIKSSETELNLKDAEILYMEGESAAMGRKIDEKVRAIRIWREGSSESDIQKKQLSIEVEHTRLENEDLMHRFDHMQKVNVEKISGQAKVLQMTEIEMSYRLKNLAAKTLAKSINTHILREKKLCLGKMNLRAYKNLRKAQVAVSLILCLQRVVTQHRSWTFHTLRRNTLIWIQFNKFSCQRRNEALSQDLYQDRLAREAYVTWRGQFNQVLEDRLRFTRGALMIERITSKNEKNILMKRFSQLYKQTHFQKRVAVFLRHIFWRNHINNLRSGFSKWLCSSLESEKHLLKESYDQEMANIKLLHWAFFSIRKYKNINKEARILNLKRTFIPWLRYHKNKRALYRQDRFFLVRNQIQSKIRLQSILGNWKHAAAKGKVNRGREDIHGVNELNREIITNYIDVTRKSCFDNRGILSVASLNNCIKVKSVRMLYSLLTTKPRKFLLKWRACAIYKTAVLQNVANKWFFSNKQALLQAFSTWRVSLYNQKSTEVSIAVTQQKEKNLTLHGSLEAYRLHFNAIQIHRKTEKVTKLGYLLKYIDSRLIMRVSGFSKYRSQYRKIIKQETRLQRLFNVMNTYFERRGFYKLKTSFNAYRTIHRQESKVQKATNKRSERVQRKYLNGWKEYSGVQKQIKRFLEKVDLKINHFVRRRYFNQWRKVPLKEAEQVFYERNIELEQEVTQLHENTRRVQNQNENLLQEGDAYVELSRRISIRLANYLHITDTSRIARETLQRWRNKAQYIKTVEEKYVKISEILERKMKRLAFSTIICCAHTRKINSLSVEIERMTEDKRQIRLNLGTLMQYNAQEAEAKQQQIVEVQREADNLARKKEELMDKFLARTRTSKAKSAIQRALVGWKKLYTARKASLAKLQSFWWRYNAKMLFVNVRETVDKEKRAVLAREKIRQATLQWQNKNLFIAMRQWRSQVVKDVSREEFLVNRHLGEELQARKKNMKAYMQTLASNIVTRGKISQTREVFDFWKALWAHKKERITKIEVVKQRLAYAEKQRIISSLREKVEYKKRLSNLERRLRQSNDREALKKHFKAIKAYLKIPRYLAERTVLYSERIKLLLKRDAFGQILGHSVHNELRTKNKIDRLSTILKTILYQVKKNNLIIAFQKIKDLAQQRFLRGRIVFMKLQGLEKLLLHKSFQKVLFYSKIQRTITINNALGPQALENFKLASRAKSARTFFKQEGYSDFEIDSYIQSRNEQRASRLRLMFNLLNNQPNPEFILPKTFMKWKRFAGENLRMKKFKRLIENRFIQSDLHQSFKLWKSFAFYKFQAPKQEMLEMLRQSDKQVRRLLEEKNSGNEAAETLSESYRYYKAFQPGIGKVAIKTFIRSFSRTMRGYMQKWKRHVETCQEEEYQRLMAGANKKIQDLENTFLAKREGLRVLEEDNKNIREVCFEGTRISKDLKILMDEREQLSLSLTDKVTYIQELMQDNATLTKRIATAQQEALQLLALTKQFTGEEK